MNQDLFSIDDTIGERLVLWHPRGARVRYLAEQLWHDEHFRHGYELVGSPRVAGDAPTNCPFHIAVYGHAQRGHRDLPLRLAELSTQDDAHIFMTREQLPVELARTLGFSLMVLRTFGFADFALTLATRPTPSVGDAAL